MNPEITRARNWHFWLWFSPLLTLPTLLAFFFYFYFPAWYVRPSARPDTALITSALLAGIWHLVLLIPAFFDKSTFVRWHGRQMLMLAAIRTAILPVIIFITLNVGSSLPYLLAFLAITFVWLVGNLLGQIEASRGECTLMRLAGNGAGLPLPRQVQPTAATAPIAPPRQAAPTAPPRQAEPIAPVTPIATPRDPAGRLSGIIRNSPDAGSRANALALLIEHRQLEFLLRETEEMPNLAAWRIPYARRLTELRARIMAMPAQAIEFAAPTPISTPPTFATEPAVLPPPPAPVPIPQPIAMEQAIPKPPPAPKEALPFDQWLLSERNIKIALYSGGALLVLAGLIWVGVNWERFPGAVKLAISLSVTAMMYAGGALLSHRPMLRLGGLTLLGVASGFLPLNFVVAQTYILDARAISADLMGLLAALTCLPIYAFTAHRTRAEMFVYFGCAAVFSAATRAMILVNLVPEGRWLILALLLLVMLIAAQIIRRTPIADYSRRPLLILSQVGMPVAFLVNAYIAVLEKSLTEFVYANVWLALAGMSVGVLFFIATDIFFRQIAARWAAAFMLATTVLLTLSELRWTTLQTGIALKLLALAFLAAGYALARREKSLKGGLPLYMAGYVVAAFVTLQSSAVALRNPDHLALALVADVILLAVSAWIHREYNWVFGAAWVAIAPVWIYAEIYLRGSVNQGLALGALMLIYNASGFALGRRALKLGMPFLSAAALLSLLVPGLTWSNSAVASGALGVIAALYILNAAWQRQPWLTLTACAAINLAAVALLNTFFLTPSLWLRSFSGATAGLSVTFILTAYTLGKLDRRAWSAPPYLFGALDFMIAYGIALTFGGTLALALSALFAILAFWLAWVERESFIQAKPPPLLTYLGAGLTLIAAYFAGDALGFQNLWSINLAVVCALYILVSLAFEGETAKRIYGTPLRRAGIALLLAPLVGTIGGNPANGAMAFGIAAGALFLDAGARRKIVSAYLGASALVVAIWYLLTFANVREAQAYVIPAGSLILAIGWIERRRGALVTYQLLTLGGLAILMGSAFIQSLTAFGYSVLLLLESLVALGWGIPARSRTYVQTAVLSLIANALAQFGPAFVELPRWVQLGTIGALLLGGGVGALFRREQILSARNAFAKEWRMWNS